MVMGERSRRVGKSADKRGRWQSGSGAQSIYSSSTCELLVTQLHLRLTPESDPSYLLFCSDCTAPAQAAELSCRCCTLVTRTPLTRQLRDMEGAPAAAPAAGMEVDEVEGGPDSSDAVVLLLQQASTDPSAPAIARLASIASSGELRDFDDLFSDPLFYRLSASLLTACWRDYDLHHSLSTDSQHQLFLLRHPPPTTTSTAQRRQREESGIDDEEDEVGDGIGSQQQQDASWTRLQAAYTYTHHLLAAPECDAALAGQRHAYDSKFLTCLLERVQPRKRKSPPHSSSSQPLQRPSLQQLQSIVGAGMLSTAGGTAAQQAQLASVPQSILSTVGLGIRAADPDSPTPQELGLLRGLLHRLYALLVPQRPLVLSLLSSFFQRFLRQPIYPHGVGDLLAVYASVVKGLRSPLLPRHVHWLVHNVLPLHLPNGMQTELMPIIQPYHEQLVYVLVEFLKKDQLTADPATPSPTLLSVLSQVLMAWPTSAQPNSAKEVLLLHEMEKLLEFTSVDAFAAFAPSFFPYLVTALSSSHHRVSERCLQLWQNDHFLSLINSQRMALFPQLMPVLLQEKHWNRSVNKMRVVVLETCREQDLALFRRCVHGLFHLGSEDDSVAQAERLMAEMRPADDAQMSEEARLLQTQALIPSSLPSVAYNEFVFGHLLGEGSFSQVRYAKRILKGLTASQWPEFAIKVVDRQLIRQQAYEANVEREQRIMATFHHPNVTSLIATCSNDHHLYFVLEYASKGDLHTHIAGLGSFSVATTRFIAAEILRGMEHLHGLRVVWGDCKPENVLVHASGHVKLTDFGSSRREEEVVEGGRVEGTEDYLAPELMKGAGISQASDLWAFGCVLYQMLAGKTPSWLKEEDDDRRTKRKRGGGKVSAASSTAQPHSSPSPPTSASVVEKAVHFGSLDDHFSDTFDPDARALISALLAAEPASRFSIVRDPSASSAASALRIDYTALKAHPFFAGVEWDVLHTLTAPTLAGGSVAPAPDAKWARRKNSLMWAPMPKAYAFSDSQFVMDTIPEADSERGSGAQPADATAAVDGRLKYVGFKADAAMSKVDEAEEEGEEEEEEEEDQPGSTLDGGQRLRRLDQDDDDNGEAPPVHPRLPAARQSSRVGPPTTRASLAADSTAGSSVLPPAHPPASLASLPPRPRLAIRSAPPPAPRTAGSASFVPDASPLSGVHVPGINGGVGKRPLGNPIAASLLSRVLGNAGGGSGREGRGGSGQPS